VEGGALAFAHRGCGSLNLNVHLHVIAADGAWGCATDGSTPEFIATHAPTRADACPDARSRRWCMNLRRCAASTA
jgi:hypothetical protein